MQMRSRAFAPGLPLLAFVCSAQVARPTSAAGAQDRVQRAEPAPPAAARVLWLTELGAESLVAPARSTVARHGTIVATVPGAAYAFDLTADGALLKRLRLAADPAAPYGVAVAERDLVLADRQGVLSRWSLEAGRWASRWRRELGERVTSVGWDGGRLVLAATWKGRLLAISALDGAPGWSIDLGGRAEAPALISGDDVFVATKSRQLLRVNAANGQVRWRVALSGTTLHPPGLLAGPPRLVVCGTLEGQLAAHEVVSGRVRWTAELDARLAGAPLVHAGGVAAVTVDGTIRGYDPAGRLSWTAAAAARGPASLLQLSEPGAAPRLLSVSRMITALDLSDGRQLESYPAGALAELRRRFADAMLEGDKTYSEPEKAAIEEQEAFEVAGPPFGAARPFGPHLAFGSEEGWVYAFDAARLRPAARYRGGEAAAAAVLLGDRALASAGDDLFALDLATGATVWRKAVGPRPLTTAGPGTVGVLAGGRLHALAAADGALEWSVRGSYRLFAAPGASVTAADSAAAASGPGHWLVADSAGELRAVLAPGRLVGEPLAIGGELLELLAVGPRSWIGATREGTLFGVGLEDLPAVAGAAASTRLTRTREKEWPEPLAGLAVAAGRALVRTASGALTVLEAESFEEVFRLALSPQDRVLVQAEDNALLVLGGAGVRVHDWTSGAPLAELAARGALAAKLRGDSLVWLDGSGELHLAALASGSSTSVRLELPLVQATPAGAGFLVTTAAGEVGFVALAEDGPAAADAQTRGVTR